MISQGLTRAQANRLYLEVLEAKDDKALRRLAQEDLFFLLTIGCKRKDADHDWIYGVCREVEAEPDGYLDLWAREHFKSSVITFTLTIKDILNDPNITVGIFSHTRPIAKAFLSQIKQEFEQNTFLKSLFPDVLWAEPKSEAAKWSLDSGIIVKRSQNPKESTIEAWGLVDGQPTSKHFALMVYDDVVTRESVSTPEQIKKTTAAWELSTNLGAQGGRKRYIGTRYHKNDTYKVMIDRGSVKTRIKPAREGGKMEGKPVFMSDELLIEKRRDQGPYTFCLGTGTRILRSDFINVPIESLKVGDEVVGIDIGGAENGRGRYMKAKLKRSKVLAVQERRHEAFRFYFDDGRSVVATQTHKWWTGRCPEKGNPRKIYRELGFGRLELSYVCKPFDIEPVTLTKDQEASANYLSGILDADGTITNNTVMISQSRTLYPDICDRIISELENLGLEHTEHITTDRPNVGRPGISKNQQASIYITGGRSALYRFLQMTTAVKRRRLVDVLYKAGTRDLGYRSTKVKLIRIEPVGMQTVYNIETETGNYIAEGYVSKNSAQMLLDPAADKSMGFKPEWLNYYKSQLKLEDLNLYLLVDPASEKKSTSDYTVMKVIGLGPDNNYYLVDAIRDRMNLTERTEKLFFLHRKYKPIKTGYEKYGKDSDIEHIKYVMEEKNYRFDITPVGGALAKEDRIKRLVPIFEQRRMWLPERLNFTDYEGRPIDYVHSFVNDEYLAFPVSVHDDMLDCMARILDPLMSAEFPKTVKAQPKQPAVYRGGQGWMG